MLRNFTAALIATALVAGPALAAQPSSNAGAAPAAPAVARTQARTHVRHARTYGQHHFAHVTKHLAKPGKVTKTNKTVKSSA